MSTISTTISTYIYYGTGQTYTSPLIITSTGAVLTTAVARAAIQGSGGGSLSNDGTVIASGASSIGVKITSGGGSINNSGFIQGYIRGVYVQGSGYLTNSGTILSVGSGAQSAVELTGGGTVSNSGTIINKASTGDGVRLDASNGTVTNSGLIQAYAESVGMEQAGVVLNMANATIRSTGTRGDAVFEGRGGGTVTNQGTIITNASGGTGVLLEYAGGTVINTGLIQAYDYGIEMEAAGFITNSSTIMTTGEGRASVLLAGDATVMNSGSIISTSFAQFGVESSGSGDTVINTGFIHAYQFGVAFGGAGVVINSGVIKATEQGFDGGDVNLPDGGSFTNTQNGYVNFGVFLNVDNDGVGADATAVNAGTITGGLYLNANSGAGGPDYVGTGTVFDSGTISGSPFAIYFGGSNAVLVLQHGYALNGLVDAAGTFPHTLELQSTAAAPVTVNFNPNEFRNFGSIGFYPGSSNAGTLALATAADLPGTIVGFTAPGDVIDLKYITDTNHDATAVRDPSTDILTVTGDNGTAMLQLDKSEDYSGVLFEAIPDASGTGTDVIPVICFCEGTQITLEDGEAPVEALKIGDRVRLFDGRVAPIVWIGQGRVLATRNNRTAATPVIIRRHALGDNIPNRDLRITKAHALYIDEVLIPVEFLINHRSILWDDRAGEVAIYHIELETHDVLIANGAPSESYRDDGNRWLFRNGNDGWDQPPKPACAPVLTGGPIVDAVWRRLLDHSGPRSPYPLTANPDLHLLADGVRRDPLHKSDVFCLPRIPRSLRIVSRAASPQELGLARDPRSLGVALRQIVVRHGNEVRVIPADDPNLTSGFHAFEPDNGFRWTDGNAALPADVFAGWTGAVTIELTIGETMRYVDEGDRRMVA